VDLTENVTKLKQEHSEMTRDAENNPENSQISPECRKNQPRTFRNVQQFQKQLTKPTKPHRNVKKNPGKQPISHKISKIAHSS
jgi:hypothetical protein